jgi:hypothetical protein
MPLSFFRGDKMTTAAMSDSPIDRQQRTYADLTVIKGIGPARQQWLRAAFGIHSLQDLAAITLDEIEAKLKASGQIASRRHISQWLAQAKQLVVAHAEPRSVQTAALENNVVTTPPSNNTEWKPFASFVVEFQTRILAGLAAEYRTKAHHIEEDTCANWPGLERTQLCQWLQEQVTTSIMKHDIEQETLLKLM